MQLFLSEFQTEKPVIPHVYADLTKLVKNLLKLFVIVTVIDGCESTITFIIFWDFLIFYQIFFHHKWNDVRLLLMNMVYMSSLTSCWTT